MVPPQSLEFATTSLRKQQQQKETADANVVLPESAAARDKKSNVVDPDAKDDSTPVSASADENSDAAPLGGKMPSVGVASRPRALTRLADSADSDEVGDGPSASNGISPTAGRVLREKAEETATSSNKSKPYLGMNIRELITSLTERAGYEAC